jgi:hypothetical protein
MRKSRLSIAWSLVLLAATAVANDFTSHDVHWGAPSSITGHLGQAFKVTSSSGARGTLKFPTRVARTDGSITYAAQFEFQADRLKFTAHCTYRNKTDDVVAELTATVAATGDSVGNGYVIAETQSRKTQKAENQCVAEITDGTYLLMENENAFRLYLDPGNFFELSPIN